MEFLNSLKDFMSAIQVAGTWGMVFFFWWQNQKDNLRWKEQLGGEIHRAEKQFQEMKQMYENNVELVKTTQQIAENMQNLVIHATQVSIEVRDIAKNNLYCPVVRKETKQREIDR